MVRLNTRLSLGCLFVICVIVSPKVWAICSCHSNDLTRGFSDLIHQVAEFSDSGTKRETVPEYASSHGIDPVAMNAAVAATGKLKCAGGEVSANITGRSNIITTCGHALFDAKTCNQISQATDCKFTLNENSAPIRVARLADSGFKCPQLPNKFGDDWAIMVLEKPVMGVTPYRLPNEDDGVSDGKKIVAAGASSVEFWRKDPRTGKRIFPKHVQDCQVQRVYRKFDPNYFTENCDGSWGRSGGALLDTDLSRPTLLGISSGNSTTAEMKEQEDKTGTPFRRPFNEQSWVSGSTAVTGKFLSALRQAVN